MPNGFIKVKVAEPDVWRLKHHLVAEEMLGRPLREGERVHLHNSKVSRKNPTPEDIIIVENTKEGKQRARKEKQHRIGMEAAREQGLL